MRRCLSVALAMLARLPVDGHYVTDMLPEFLLLGIGAGVSFPALMTLAMTGTTESDSGLASGLVNTTAQVGAALGLSVLTAVATSHTVSLAATGVGEAAARTGGYRLAFAVGAALAVAAIAVVATVLRRVSTTDEPGVA